MRDRNPVLCTMKLCKFLLELQRFRPRGSPPYAAFQNFLHGLSLAVIKLRPYRERFLLCLFASADCQFAHARLLKFVSTEQTRWHIETLRRNVHPCEAARHASLPWLSICQLYPSRVGSD